MKKCNFILRALVICGFLQPILALGAEKNERVYFYLIGNQAVSDFEDRPMDIETKHLHTPAILGINFNTNGFWGDIKAGFVGYTVVPALGFAFGGAFPIGVAELKIGGEFETNGALNSEMNKSYLSSWNMGPMLSLSIQRGILRPSLEAHAFYTSDSTVSESEGISTKIIHDTSYMFKPSVIVDFSMLKAEGAISFYRLGKSGVASDEFAFPIDAMTVIRPMVGAGIQIGNVEAWLKAAAIYGGPSDDSVEYLYAAPYYLKENLMMKKSISAEVRFSL